MPSTRHTGAKVTTIPPTPPRGGGPSGVGPSVISATCQGHWLTRVCRRTHFPLRLPSHIFPKEGTPVSAHKPLWGPAEQKERAVILDSKARPPCPATLPTSCRQTVLGELEAD